MRPELKATAEALGMYAHRESGAIEQLIDEMVEGGCSLTTAEIIAPLIAPFTNDPRGLAEALKDGAPKLAECLGLLRRN